MLDARRENGHVDLRVEVNGQESDREWVGMKLVMENSKHVVGVITERRRMGSRTVAARTIYANDSTIKIQYGQFPSKTFNRTFRGYITGHKVLDAVQDRRGRFVEIRYSIIGTSKPMQSKHSGTYRTWSQAAKAIAKRHKLRAVVHQTPRASKPIIQTVSDFRLLAEGAEKTGYRFFVDGSTLYFIDPKKMLNTSGRDTPKFFRDGLGLSDSLHQITVDSDGSAAEQSSWEILGLTPTGARVKATGGSGSVTRGDQTLVESYAEAREAMEARDRLSTMWVRAGAETHGDVRVVPGRVINVQGNQVPDESRGLWIVRKVLHLVDLRRSRSLSSGYVLEIEMERDRTRAVQVSSDPTAETDWEPETDDEEDTIPWDPMEEWLVAVEQESALEVDGTWQAEYYGDIDP